MRIVILMVIAGFAAAAICALVVWPLLVAKLLAAHQQSITAELAQWGREYSTIRDANEAGRSLEMLEYIERYYVVAPGYSSNPETDSRLDRQRDETMQSISRALDRFIEGDACVNADVWRSRKSSILNGTRWEAN